jgi:hypothetical protein
MSDDRALLDVLRGFAMGAEMSAWWRGPLLDAGYIASVEADGEGHEVMRLTEAGRAALVAREA